MGVDFSKFLYSVMGIDLCGGQVGMTKDLFHRVQVSSMLKHVGGEGVPQHVRTTFSLGGDPPKVVFYETLYAASRQLFASLVYKQGI